MIVCQRGDVPRDGPVGVVIDGEEHVLDGRLEFPHRSRPRDLHIWFRTNHQIRNPQSHVASGIHQPNQSAKKNPRRTEKGAGLVGTEVGGVELVDGEAEALRLR
jgi:hypothetical protein